MVSVPAGDIWIDLIECTCVLLGWHDVETPYSERWHVSDCPVRCGVDRCVVGRGHAGAHRTVGNLRSGL